MPSIDPEHDCPLCPRLVAYRVDNRTAYPDWFNGPVPVWQSHTPRLAIVGLAPGLRGANRTGRPFTGDYAGDLLFQTLLKFGLAEGSYDARPDDGLNLIDTAIINSVRCVPPQNKPIGAEIANCRPYLSLALEKLNSLQAYLALGRIAHDSLLTALGLKRAAYPFGHGRVHALPDGRVLFDSYHCSRYNTNTRRLTEQMFEDVVGKAAAVVRVESRARFGKP